METYPGEDITIFLNTNDSGQLPNGRKISNF